MSYEIFSLNRSQTSHLHCVHMRDLTEIQIQGSHDQDPLTNVFYLTLYDVVCKFAIISLNAHSISIICLGFTYFCDINATLSFTIFKDNHVYVITSLESLAFICYSIIVNWILTGKQVLTIMLSNINRLYYISLICYSVY